MSNFSETLGRIMEKQQPPVTLHDIARHLGSSEAHASRLVSGRQKFVSDEDFIKILEKVATTQRDRAALVAARCLDHKIGPGSEMVRISIGNKKSKGEREFQLELDQETEEAFDYLRSIIPQNPKVKEMVIGWAGLLGKT